MGFVTWLPNSNGDWDTAADWSTGTVPTSNDQVTISTTSIQTISHSMNVSDFARSLSVGNDIFNMTNGSLSITDGASMATGFTMSGGDFTTGTTFSSTGGSFALSGGTLTVGSTLTVADSFSQTGGELFAQSVMLKGPVQLQGGSLGGTTVLQAAKTIILGNYRILSSAELLNTNIVDQTGAVTLGDSGGVDATISTAAGATYNFANATSINSGAATAQFLNAGTLAALAGTGLSVINVKATNTGIISIAAGSEIAFGGALNSLSGTIAGAGTLGLDAGSTTISVATIATGAVALLGNGTTLALGESVTVTGSYTQRDGSILSLGGNTLTLMGSAQFTQGSGSPLIAGGTLITDGAVGISGTSSPGLVIATGAVWNNFGTVTETQSFTIGNAASGTASVTNEAGAVFNLAASGDTIVNGSTPPSSFVNAGTLEMLASGGGASVNVDLTSSGTVTVGAGDNLQLNAPANSLAGSITGAGQLSFGGGISKIAGGTIINVGTLALYNNATTLMLGGNVTVSGDYAQSNGTALSLNGHTLTLTGPAQFTQFSQSPSVTGGTLITKGATGISGSSNPGLIISGGAAWKNYGTVTGNQSFQIGDAAGAATVTNEAKSVFNLAVNGVTVNNGSTPASTFVNAGTLQEIASGGSGYVNVGLTSTGTVKIAANSNLVLNGASNSLAGSISIGSSGNLYVQGAQSSLSAKISGAGTLAFDAGIATLAAGTIAAGAVAVSGTTTLALGGNLTVSGSYSQSGGSTVSLAGNTLTLMGSAQFTQSSGTPLITGGTLVTDGATSIGGGGPGLVIATGAVWNNFGTVTESQSFTIGNSASGAGIVTNEAGAVFTLSAAVAINNNSTPASTFTNAGTLQITAASGTGSVNVGLTSTGLVSVAAGADLDLNGGSNNLSGSVAIGSGGELFVQGLQTSLGAAVKGAGTVAFSGGSTTITTGTIATAAVALNNNATTLTLGGNVTVSGNYTQSNGSTLALGGFTLTLLGSAQFTQNSQTPLITGGTLVTKGATTVQGGNPGLVIASGASWNNFGTTTAIQTFTLGNASSAAATLTNEAGAVFNLAANGVTINNGSTPASSFVNLGTLQMTASSGSSAVNVGLTSTGLVSVAAGADLFLNGASNALSGSIFIDNGGDLLVQGTQTSLGGAITGAGTLAFSGGSTTVTSGTIAVGAVAVSGTATLALGGNLTVSGSYTQSNGSTLALGGDTLTLLGTAQFTQSSGSPLVSGGTLVTDGATGIGGGNPGLVIATGAAWNNFGTATDTQSFTIGNSASGTGTLINEAAAVFNLAVNGVSINSGSTPISTFTNAGTLQMLAAGGTAYITANLASTGTVSVAAGDNLQLSGPANKLSGSITGAGQLSFGAGNSTLAGSTVISVGTLALYNNATTLALGGNVTVSGGFAQSNGSVLSLNGHTLTLTGNAQFTQSSGTPTITGGTLVTDGFTAIGGGGTGLVVASGAGWTNAGTVVASQSVTLGNSASAAATLTNTGKGVYDLAVNGASINNGSTPVSSFVNAGTLEMTAINGAGSVGVSLANNGTVLTQNGLLTLTGNVTGTGVLDIGASGTLSVTSLVQSTETLKFLDDTGLLRLTLPTPTAFAAEITNFTQGDTIDLTGIANATASFSGGVLTFTNSSQQTVAVLNFAGSPSFAYSSDGNGGTFITDPQAGQGKHVIGPVTTDTAFDAARPDFSAEISLQEPDVAAVFLRDMPQCDLSENSRNQPTHLTPKADWPSGSFEQTAASHVAGAILSLVSSIHLT